MRKGEKNNDKQKNFFKLGGFVLPDCNINYKDTALKTVMLLKRTKDQGNRTP